jgi:O-antigen ligase
LSDFFAVAGAAWILASSALNGGFRPYVGAEALDFLGAYLVGRAFVIGPSNFRTFARALGPITIALVALAVLDILVGRYITLDSFGIPNQAADRFGWVRAASVFPNAEHYGTFCVVAASIFLYSERSIRRVVYVSLSVLGCALSLSSGPFFGLAIVAAAFSYDCILNRYHWRWKILMTMVGGFVTSVFLITGHPVVWILLHLTLDPQTGFFRLATWNSALPLISESPFVGHGLVQLGDSGDAQFFLSSVDNVWLLEALRYGLPGVILLAMTIFTPLLRGASTVGTSSVQTGLSLAIVAIALIGLTVHFWNATWLFLHFCVGIRASFCESRSIEMWRADRAARASASMKALSVGFPGREKSSMAPR